MIYKGFYIEIYVFVYIVPVNALFNLFRIFFIDLKVGSCFYKNIVMPLDKKWHNYILKILLKKLCLKEHVLGHTGHIISLQCRINFSLIILDF